MKIARNWITTTPTVTTGTILSGFDVSDINQGPDVAVLSERGIFEGTTATVTMTTTTQPQDVILFDFLGNKIVLDVEYTDTADATVTKSFEIQDQLSTEYNDWSTVFQTQSTNSWTDLDHLTTFSDAKIGTSYSLAFQMDTVENESNDIKSDITAWADSSFNSVATYIPLGSRVTIDDGGTITTHQITQIFGNGTSDNSVVLNGTPPATGTITSIYRPISLSKCLVSTNTFEINNPHWGMSRKRNVIQSSHNMHRGRLVPLNRQGIKYDSYTLSTGLQDLMSQDFIDYINDEGTAARPMQVISENVEGPRYDGREWIIFGQFQGLPTETLDARGHRNWSMELAAGII